MSEQTSNEMPDRESEADAPLGAEFPTSEPSAEEAPGENPGGAPAEQPFVSLGFVLPGTPLELPASTYLRLDVLSGNVVVPALIWVNADHRDRLLVAMNGAVARRSAKKPTEVFQRRTWVEDIEASVVFLADPTLQSDNTISIGWGQGGPGSYAIPAMAQTAQYIAGLLGVPSERRVYFGSSAGGFQALQLGIRDPDAKVLVNNAQFDWTRYEPMNVRSICRHSYDGAAVEKVAKAHLGRTSVIEAAREQGAHPRIRYLLNAASPDDSENQLPAIIAALGRDSSLSSGGALDVALYSDPKTQHSPISKSRTLAEINSAFERSLDRS